MLTRFFAALSIFLVSTSSSSAVPFTIEYTGTITGWYFDIENFIGEGEPTRINFSAAATEIYRFDTDRLVVDPIYGMIDSYGEGQLTSSVLNAFTGGNTLDMSITDGIPVINSISSGIGNGYSRMYVIGASGAFQFGTCPSGRPSCGAFSAASFTITGYPGLNVSAVPTPILGAGLPSLLMAVAGFIGWRRTQRSRAITAKLQAAL